MCPPSRPGTDRKFPSRVSLCRLSVVGRSCCDSDAYSDVDEHRMFKNAGYSVKHPLSVCLSPPSPALLPRRHATTSISSSIDGLKRRLLGDQSSGEKKNKRGNNKDDPSKPNTPVSPIIFTDRSLAKSNAMKSAYNSCRVVYTAKYLKMFLSLPQNLVLSVLLENTSRCMVSIPKKVPCSLIQASLYPLFKGLTSTNTFTVLAYVRLVRGLTSLLVSQKHTSLLPPIIGTSKLAGPSTTTGPTARVTVSM
jgi:hypothetical protein